MSSLFASNSSAFSVRGEKYLSLSPNPKPPNTYPIGAFDIEGVGGPNGLLCAGVMTENSYELFYNPQSLVDYLKTRKFVKYRFAAHNLTYDYSIIEPYFEKEDYPLLINGRVFRVSVHRNKANTRFLVDSLNLAGGLPLATVGDALKLPKLKTPEDILAFNPNYSPAERLALTQNSTTMQYLERDVQIVYEYMRLFQQTINELGGEVKFTLASTAMDLYRRSFLKEEYRSPLQARNDYARKAYYGGRVEPFILGLSKDVNIYDINSLYPYVMRTFQYPNPNTLIGPVDNHDKKLIWQKEGVSDVIIDIPDCYIPSLPYRHNEKLYFPYGRLRGHYTHIELRKAVELGAKIQHVFSSLYSEDTCSPFIDYVDTLYAMRQQLKQNHDSREYVIKIMLNSLYGKFGQRLDAGLQELKSILWWLDGHQTTQCEFREIDGQVWVILDKKSPMQAPYVNTLWASYVTSYARLELLNYMLLADRDLIYGDTDSIFVHGTLPTSAALGAMKQEYEGVNVEIYGPKAYFIHNEDYILAEKCKGVPSEQRLKFLIEGQASFFRPTGLLEASRLKPLSDGTILYPAVWREVTKRQHTQEPKRFILQPDFHYSQNSTTSPFLASALK